MTFLPKKFVIYGCESRGDAKSAYLTRWTLWKRTDEKGETERAIYLHIFHRSDGDEHHDHPWDFVSVILWRGYFEETPSDMEVRGGSVADMESLMTRGEGWLWGGYSIGDSAHVFRYRSVKRKRVWPGMILRRPATWRHRVALVNEKPAVTLIFRGKRLRRWGFFTRFGWQFWEEYFQERGC